MLDQLDQRDTVEKKEGFVKEAIHTAEQLAKVGIKADLLKKRASNAIDDGILDAKRMVKHGVYAAEDLIDDTAHRIKKDPLRSVALTFGIGLGVGVAIGWLISHRSTDQ